MKKIFILFLILFLGVPVFADLINPNIPKDKYYKVRIDKRVYNQRISLLKRICGTDLLSEDKKACKSRLKKEMKEIEEIINEY